MSTRVGGIGNLRRVANEYLGAGGRLEGGPAPELVRSGYAHEVAAGPRLYTRFPMAPRFPTC